MIGLRQRRDTPFVSYPGSSRVPMEHGGLPASATMDCRYKLGNDSGICWHAAAFAATAVFPHTQGPAP